MNDILEHQKAVMNNIAKSFGVENSEDNLEKHVAEFIPIMLKIGD